jgi:hypothetical protein
MASPAEENLQLKNLYKFSRNRRLAGAGVVALNYIGDVGRKIALNPDSQGTGEASWRDDSDYPFVGAR